MVLHDYLLACEILYGNYKDPRFKLFCLYMKQYMSCKIYGKKHFTLSIIIGIRRKIYIYSGLIRIPNLYANFVEEQYKSIFAIALPYTNPFK